MEAKEERQQEVEETIDGLEIDTSMMPDDKLNI